MFLISPRIGQAKTLSRTLNSLPMDGVQVCFNAVLVLLSHKLIRTNVLSFEQASKLQTLEEVYDFWRPARSGLSTDIMVGPLNQKYLYNLLSNLGVEFVEVINDIGTLIEEQKVKSLGKNYQGKISFDQYYPHDDLNAYIDDLATQFDFVNTVSIGKSHEGRDMRVIQIAKAGPGAPNVWIEAGIHAREWIAPAMATYIIDSLLNNDVDNFTDTLNIHVLPSTNPDGYEYSQKSDRLWRKTRSNYNSIFLCKGVDGNRNWDYHWAETGASGNKCAETYHGPEAFSEIETQNVRDYVLALEPVPVLAQCLHSYSQLWLWPFGYENGGPYPENVDEIRGLADDAVKALEAVHGTVFENINSADLYPAAGASDDWYKGVLKARFAYTIELRDTGRHGFVLPADQIKPSGEELWEAERVVLQKMVDVSSE